MDICTSTFLLSLGEFDPAVGRARTAVQTCRPIRMAMDPSQVSPVDWVSILFFRGIRTSFVLAPWIFGTVALNEGVYSLVHVRPKYEACF